MPRRPYGELEKMRIILGMGEGIEKKGLETKIGKNSHQYTTTRSLS